MIYALQPEMRRISANFSIRWGVTMCVPAQSVVYQLRPGALQRAGCAWRTNRSERRVKMLERPRREEVEPRHGCRHSQPINKAKRISRSDA